jgi:hypothetical protein
MPKHYFKAAEWANKHYGPGYYVINYKEEWITVDFDFDALQQGLTTQYQIKGSKLNNLPQNIWDIVFMMKKESIALGGDLETEKNTMKLTQQHQISDLEVTRIMIPPMKTLTSWPQVRMKVGSWSPILVKTRLSSDTLGHWHSNQLSIGRKWYSTKACNL